MILRGEGSVFSAGHDLIELKNAAAPEIIFNQCTKTMLCLKNMGLITLCAVDNAVTAAGLQLALTCDMIIAA
jgi:enoyl-CoA hydratase/carnithine racemase